MVKYAPSQSFSNLCTDQEGGSGHAQADQSECLVSRARVGAKVQLRECGGGSREAGHMGGAGDGLCVPGQLSEAYPACLRPAVSSKGVFAHVETPRWQYVRCDVVAGKQTSWMC